MVPSVAIVTNKGQTGVLVPGSNNKPKFQPVTIGSSIGNETQVLEGVKVGDSVFVELPEGQKLDDITKGMNQGK
jgi:HlyD family secretion protein